MEKDMNICLFFVCLFNIIVCKQIWLVEFSEPQKSLEELDSLIPRIDFIQKQSTNHLFLVPDDEAKKFEDFIDRSEGRYRVILENSNDLLKQNVLRKKRWVPSTNPLDAVYYRNFLSYDEQNNWYRLLANSNQTRSHLKFYKIGETYENRSLTVIEIREPTELKQNLTRRRTRKRSVFIDSGMHAREWLSIGVANYLISRFIRTRENDVKVKRIFRYFNIFLLPMVNPDGYEYSRTVDRLWRKNRSPTSHSDFWNGDSMCHGVDLNRNFPYKWSPTNYETAQVCTSSYRGPSAASELEVQSIMSFLKRFRPYAYFNLHAYGRLWLLPWAHTRSERIDHFHNLFNRASRINERITNGTYTIGQAAIVLYQCSGTSLDYASTMMEHAMTFELSPIFKYLPLCFGKNLTSGENCSPGFLLGPDSIEKDGEEIFSIIVDYLYSLIQDNFL